MITVSQILSHNKQLFIYCTVLSVKKFHHWSNSIKLKLIGRTSDILLCIPTVTKHISGITTNSSLHKNSLQVFVLDDQWLYLRADSDEMKCIKGRIFSGRYRIMLKNHKYEMQHLLRILLLTFSSSLNFKCSYLFLISIYLYSEMNIDNEWWTENTVDY